MVVGHGGLTSDEVATARKSRKRPHQRLTGCVEATTSKRRSRRSLELAGQRVFAKTRELGEGEAPAAMAAASGCAVGGEKSNWGWRLGRAGVGGFKTRLAMPGCPRRVSSALRRAATSGATWPADSEPVGHDGH